MGRGVVTFRGIAGEPLEVRALLPYAPQSGPEAARVVALIWEALPNLQSIELTPSAVAVTVLVEEGETIATVADRFELVRERLLAETARDPNTGPQDPVKEYRNYQSPSRARVEHYHDGHDGPGWYYFDESDPGDGSVGAFLTLDQAIRHAHNEGYLIESVSQAPVREGRPALPPPPPQRHAHARDERCWCGHEGCEVHSAERLGQAP